MSYIEYRHKVKHIVFYSGGIGSYGAAKRVVEKYGTSDLILFFTDTKMEDKDLYRFLNESASNIGGEFVSIADGRNPWQVFKDVRFLGNSRIDPCSKVLKRDIAKKWIMSNYGPNDCVLYLGIDWTEEHRYLRSKMFWEPYTVQAPLCQKPFVLKSQLLNDLDQVEIKPPRLYGMGFAHNNCGGFCIKAGQAQFKLLLEKFPKRYAAHEEREREIRSFLNKDVSILRRVKGGVSSNLTLEQLRLEVEIKSKDIDENDWGGCGCFMDDGTDEDLKDGAY